jgi:hypothetical protein
MISPVAWVCRVHLRLTRHGHNADIGPLMSRVSPDPMSHDVRGNSVKAHPPDSRQRSGARVYAHRNMNPTVSADWWVPSGLFVLRKYCVTN